MKYGQKVTVHLYGGTTGLRHVVRDYGDVVVICSAEEFKNSIKEKRRARGIGFPAEDVIRPVDPDLSDIAKFVDWNQSEEEL